MKNNSYRKRALRYFRFAKNELKEAALKKDVVRAQQAAEKGYLSLINIMNAYFVNCGVKEDKLPQQERGRLYLLRKYGNKELRKKYSQIRHDLHIDAFHGGIIYFDHLEEVFADLEEVIENLQMSTNTKG